MKAYRYFRWYITSSSTNYVHTYNIQFYSLAGVAVTVPNGTSVATSSDYYSGGYEATHLFDNTPSGNWHSNSVLPHWAKLDLGAGNSAKIYSYKINTRVDTHFPLTWKMEGSEDDSVWDTLDEQVNYNWNGNYNTTFDLLTTADWLLNANPSMLDYFDLLDASGLELQNLINPLDTLILPNDTGVTYGSTSMLDDISLSLVSVTASTSTSIFNLNTLTKFSMAVLFQTTTELQTILSKSGVFSLSIDTDSKLVFSINSDSVISDSVVTDNLPKFVICNYDSGKLSLHINSISEGEYQSSSTSITDSNTSPVVLGAYTGNISNVGFFSDTFKLNPIIYSYLQIFGITPESIHVIPLPDIDNLTCVDGAGGITVIPPPLNILNTELSVDYNYVNASGLVSLSPNLFYIDGYVTVEGTPASRQVWLFDWITKIVLSTQWSDPVTGYYKFDQLKYGKYFVWSADYTEVYHPLTTTRVESTL